VVMSMASAMGLLTYRSFMSSVINLCLLLMLSCVRFCATVDEFFTVYWCVTSLSCSTVLRD
jgi:hypothetical protein